MSPEREAEIRRVWQQKRMSTLMVEAQEDVLDLLSEIDRLRAEIAALREAGDKLYRVVGGVWMPSAAHRHNVLERWREAQVMPSDGENPGKAHR